MNDKGVECLRCAIVKQAVEDYLEAKKRYSESNSIGALHTISECKRFFRSEYYQILTDIDGETLIQLLDKKHEEEMNSRRNHSFL